MNYLLRVVVHCSYCDRSFMPGGEEHAVYEKLVPFPVPLGTVMPLAVLVVDRKDPAVPVDGGDWFITPRQAVTRERECDRKWWHTVDTAYRCENLGYRAPGGYQREEEHGQRMEYRGERLGDEDELSGRLHGWTFGVVAKQWLDVEKNQMVCEVWPCPDLGGEVSKDAQRFFVGTLVEFDAASWDGSASWPKVTVGVQADLLTEQTCSFCRVLATIGFHSVAPDVEMMEVTTT